MDFMQELTKRCEEAERVIREYMPEHAQFQKTVVDAMQYTMSAGGKRIRPILMKASYELFGGTGELIFPFMAAIEMIHTYSLIHDDLPALDNDDYRRGRKTAHIVYGEAMAILAGDGLLNFAYETAVKAFSLVPEGEDELFLRKRVEHAIRILTEKPGIYGMIGGQTADVELTGKELTKEQLHFIYKNKTGALIEASMMIGAILAGAQKEQISDMQKAAEYIGMAFQIQDDILDETASFEELGKPIHSDAEVGKFTYVTIYGMEQSIKEVERLSEEAVTRIRSVNEQETFLIRLVEYLVHRKK